MNKDFHKPLRGFVDVVLGQTEACTVYTGQRVFANCPVSTYIVVVVVVVVVVGLYFDVGRLRRIFLQQPPTPTPPPHQTRIGV